MSRVKDAERRPAGSPIEAAERTLAGRSKPTLVVPAESRLTFALPIPHRATLRFYAAVPGGGGDASIVFRAGISDDRFYQTLVEQTVTSADGAARGWIALAADLSRFAGRQLSLFYHPDARRWRIVIATHVTGGSPGEAWLGEPAIVTDVESARDYFRRLASR